MTARAVSGRTPRPASFIHDDTTLARAARPLVEFTRIEASGGLVLAASAFGALVWANSPWSAGYHALWASPVRAEAGPVQFGEDLRHVVNDALMAIFFLVVGLELKRELVAGQLRDRKQVALPALAALGGMVVPALVYAAVNVGHPSVAGWGTPMATDIAFVIGVMALLGRRIPASLKVFVLTLAIVDDLGAIVVIALFYSDRVDVRMLAVAVAVAATVAALRRLRVTYPPVYVATGIALWWAVFSSGVHAAIAGVVIGLLTPARAPRDATSTDDIIDALGDSREPSAEDVRATAAAIKESVPPCDRLINLLHPWTGYVIIPLFALANAGIALGHNPVAEPRVLIGVVVGLVAGKLIGITVLSWVAVCLGAGQLPPDTTWRHIVAAAALCGTGFTVSLFIGELAFDGAAAETAKVGILAASIVAATIGSALFVHAARHATPGEDPPHSPVPHAP